MSRARMPTGCPAGTFALDGPTAHGAAPPAGNEPVGVPEEAPLPAGDEKRRAVRQMFDTIAGRYDVLNRVNSLGMDRHWRRRALDVLDLPAGSRVLDVACGTGDLCDELARRLMQPVGLDLSSGMLGQARRRRAGSRRRASSSSAGSRRRASSSSAGSRRRASSSSAGSTGMLAEAVRRRAGSNGERPGNPAAAPLVLGDALAAPFRPASFDGAVSAFALRNVVDLGQLFRELARLVRPGGRISLLDLGEPEGRLLRFGHGLWTKHAVPLVGSLFSDADAYRYLPKSLAYLPAPDQVVGLLEEAGWKAVERLLLAGGTSQVYIATRAGHPEA